MPNTYEFKHNKKKIILKFVKPKSNVKNNKEETVNTKDSETSCYLVNKSQFSPESLSNGSTLSKSSTSILPLVSPKVSQLSFNDD